MLKDGDIASFVNACEKELAYFDNVWFEGCHLADMKNEYEIIERNTFKYRVDEFYSNSLHLVIGKVSYPIEWQHIANLEDSLFSIRRGLPPLPIALKFDIGELPITPERESVRYVEFTNQAGEEVETARVIRDRYFECVQELQTIYNEQCDPYEDDLASYLGNQHKEANIILGGNVINISSAVNKIKQIFTPLSGFLGELPNSPLFEYVVKASYTRGGKMHHYAEDRIVQLRLDTLYSSLVIRYPISGKFNRKKNEYFFDYFTDLGKTGNTLYFVTPVYKEGNIKERKARIRIARKTLKLPSIKRIDYEETNLTSQLKLYRDVMMQEVLNNSSSYDITIPQDWLKEWERINGNKRTKKEEEIVAYLYNYGIAVKEYLNLERLENHKGMILYGFEEDELYLRGFKSLLSQSSFKTSSNNIDTDKCLLIKIARRTEKSIIGFKHAIDVHNFMSNNEIFRKIVTAIRLEKESLALNFPIFTSHRNQGSRVDQILPIEAIRLIFPSVVEAYEELEQYHKDNGGRGLKDPELNDIFVEELIALAKEQEIVDSEVLELNSKVDRYFKGLELLNFIHFTHSSLPYIVNFFKLSGKPVGTIWSKDSLEYDIYQSFLPKLVYIKDLCEQGEKSTQKSSMGYYDKNRTIENLNRKKNKVGTALYEYDIIKTYYETTEA